MKIAIRQVKAKMLREQRGCRVFGVQKNLVERGTVYE